MPFPVSSDFISAEEEKLGIRLPASFRTYLVHSNGGEVEVEDDGWQVVPVFDGSDRKRIARTANHIARETAVARQWPGFPDSAVVVGTNGSGDLLILLPSSDAAVLGEPLYLWRHETGDSVLVASAFSEVVGGVV